MFCSKCGTENLSFNRFCGSCGQILFTNDTDPGSPPTSLDQHQAPPPPPVYPQPVPAESAFSLYIGCFKKYAQFKGRARCSEFFYFSLIDLGIIATFLFFEKLVFAPSSSIGKFIGILETVYVLARFIPSLAVSARRLHDIGHSGKWIIVYFIFPFILLYIITLFLGNDITEMVAIMAIMAAIIVAIVCFLFLLRNSQRGTNKYGPSPKYPESPLQVSP